MAFEVTIGPHTTRVECELIEDMAARIAHIDVGVEDANAKLDQILAALGGQTAAPRIEFTIGPIREKE